ncbi:hypothetical protein [Actinokineospora inagensis]|nr:hypothetical protein [Actinokineospora inagensis]
MATAVAEAQSLQESLLVDAAATRDEVVAAMSKATWAHFACHAITDPA